MTARADSSKVQWRARLLAARAALPARVLAERAERTAAGAAALAAAAGGPVCAYLPMGSEPGGPLLVERLAAGRHEVLLPVVPSRPGPLDWARYDGADGLVPGPLGLREPAGPRLGPPAIGGARLVLVPALAADLRGHRLGRGGGYYDRTLPLAAAGTALVVLLHDEELVDELPVGPHDHPATAALLPGAGLRPLGNSH